MPARLVRVISLLAALAALGFGAASALAQGEGEPDEGDGGYVQPSTPPSNAKFGLDVEDTVLSRGADLDDFDHGGAPISMGCVYTGRTIPPGYDDYPEWTTSCGKVKVKVTLTRHVAKILGFHNRVIFDDYLEAPKYVKGVDDAPNSAKADDFDYHLVLSSSARKKLKPVGYIKYVSMTGTITGPKGESITLEKGDGDWGGRRTPGGIVCPSKDINLTIRPHKHAPYCPGGLGGVASPKWYTG